MWYYDKDNRDWSKHYGEYEVKFSLLGAPQPHDSFHKDKEVAAKRVHWLNGGNNDDFKSEEAK